MASPMTPEKQIELDKEDAERRTIELRKLFVEVQEGIRLQIDKLSELAPPELKKMQSKLNELQTIQLTLMRAEEAFHDTFRTDADKQKHNYDDIRRQVGRALCRLRDTLPAEGVSGGSCRSPD